MMSELYNTTKQAGDESPYAYEQGDMKKKLLRKKPDVMEAVGAKKAPESETDMPLNPKKQYGSRPGEKRMDVREFQRPLGSFKKGGKVKKTGVYRLHKGERVLNTRQVGKMGKALSGK